MGRQSFFVLQSWISKTLTSSLGASLGKAACATKKEEAKMISAASSLEKLVALWDQAGNFLTPAEFGKALALGKGFLLDYKWLSAWSLEKDRNSFSIVAKFHTFSHLLVNSQFMNRKKQWNFRAEDYVGHISKITYSNFPAPPNHQPNRHISLTWETICHQKVFPNKHISKD